jgi:lipopolysaccharide transport system ATP-binding protein
MSDIALRAEDLGKRYHIGHVPEHRTLGENLVRVAGAPVRALRNLGCPSSPPVAVDPHEFWALQDVSFEVARGEVLGIVGRNGAGKSTLLKIFSRITEPTTGSVEIRGRVSSLLEVGTGFHQELTGRENIYLNGAILGMRTSEIRAKFDRIVDFSGVEEFLDTPVKRYSSGMRVRLAFAVAAHLEPDILIIDEVLAVGDAEFRQKCLGTMNDVAGSGRTLLFVSHDIPAVENLCSRALLLDHGQIRAHGDVRPVLESYLASFSRSAEEADDSLANDPTSGLELLSTGLVDETGGSVGAICCGGDLRIRLNLRARHDLDDLIVAVGINSSMGVRTAVLKNEITGDPLSVSRGMNSIECCVSRFPLIPGRYFIDVHIERRKKLLLWVPVALSVTVERGDFFGSGILPAPHWGGSIYLDHRWSGNALAQHRSVRPGDDSED